MVREWFPLWKKVQDRDQGRRSPPPVLFIYSGDGICGATHFSSHRFVDVYAIILESHTRSLIKSHTRTVILAERRYLRGLRLGQIALGLNDEKDGGCTQ